MTRGLGGTALAVALALGLLGGSGCAQKTDWVQGTLVTVDVTGLWKGRMTTVPGGLGGELEMTLAQRGAKVTGNGRLRTQTIGVEGTVRGDVFTFSDGSGRLRAQATVTGDEMSGEGRTGVSGQPVEFRFTLAR